MNKPKILIVDDDVKLLSLTKVILEKIGSFEIHTEHRSFAALQRAQAFGPDLVILDVDMPGKDGGDVAAELGRDSALCKVPVIFLTSLVTSQEAGTRKDARFLAKPVSPQLLLQTVREALAEAA